MNLPGLLFGAAVAGALAFMSGAAHAKACHTAGHYEILEIENVESAGTRFAVRKHAQGAPGTCRFKAANADFIIGGEDDPLWFAALTSRYLVMTRSTGPQGDVVFYDLDRRAVAHEAPADDVELVRGVAVYWERVAEGTPANCPEFEEYDSNGLGAAITAETQFDLATGAVKATGQTRCDATQ